MKKTLASLLAVGALMSAGAALAQDIDSRIDRLERRIDHGVDTHSLTPDQAVTLRGELHQVTDMRDNALRDGSMSDWRRQDLAARLDRIDYQVSRDKYFARYGSYRGYTNDWRDDDDDMPR